MARRIAELQVRNERKAEMAALSSDELIGILTENVHAARSRLQEVRMADGLKAAELLSKLCGYNEPEKHEHAHQHLHVDAGLLAQLREGYATLSTRGVKGARLLAEAAGGGIHPQLRGYVYKREDLNRP